jgi:hypothetical protein
MMPLKLASFDFNKHIRLGMWYLKDEINFSCCASPIFFKQYIPMMFKIFAADVFEKSAELTVILGEAG